MNQFPRYTEQPRCCTEQPRCSTEQHRHSTEQPRCSTTQHPHSTEQPRCSTTRPGPHNHGSLSRGPCCAAGRCASAGAPPCSCSCSCWHPRAEPAGCYGPLPIVHTVVDVWREWTVGLAGRPALRELEERWGSRWRPGNTVKVQICRRKVFWDAIRARTARGRTEEEAVAELELLRAGRGLNQLVEELAPAPPASAGGPRAAATGQKGGVGGGRGGQSSKSGRGGHCGRRGDSPRSKRLA